MGAVLRHVEAGFRANALCAWVVPVDKLDEIAQKLAQCPSISHCYDRILLQIGHIIFIQ